MPVFPGALRKPAQTPSGLASSCLSYNRLRFTPETLFRIHAIRLPERISMASRNVCSTVAGRRGHGDQSIPDGNLASLSRILGEAAPLGSQD